MPTIINRLFTPTLQIVFCLLLIMFTFHSQAGWEATWIEKFEGTSVNWDNWTAQTQANYNNEVQCYTDDDSSENRNYEVSDGTLKIISRRQAINCPGQNNRPREWTSGRLNSKDKAEFLYGRVEARIRFLELKGGTWPAFWMLENRISEQPVKGDNDNINWPNPGAGEIDVWEWYSNNGSRYITNFFNVQGCGSERRIDYPNGAIDVTQFNVYAIEWDKDNIKFFMNDQVVAEHDLSNCSQYEEPMFVLINVAMGGNLGGAIDPTLNSATMEVDYVAHCSPTNDNTETFCNESTPMMADDDNDGVANGVDQCPDTPPDTPVDTTGCTVFTSPQSKAPPPSVSEANVISVYSDAYQNIGGVDINPDWGQATQVTEVDIDGSLTIKYENLNYQGIDYGGNKQDVSDKEFLHLDYWTHNATSLSVFLISPGPRENPFAIDIVQQSWQSLKIPLSNYTAVDLTDTFQMKFEGNGTVYIDNIFFSSSQANNADSDGDGVNDDIDQCPNTDAGVLVDSTGCPISINIAPTVTLIAQQANETISQVDTLGGTVSVTANVVDPNSVDTHTIAWSVTGITNFEQNENVLTFDPANLTVSQVTFQVSVTDTGAPPLSTEANLQLNVATPQPPPQPSQPPIEDDSSSNGGSMNAFWLVCLLILARARNIQSKL